MSEEASIESAAASARLDVPAMSGDLAERVPKAEKLPDMRRAPRACGKPVYFNFNNRLSCSLMLGHGGSCES